MLVCRSVKFFFLFFWKNAQEWRAKQTFNQSWFDIQFDISYSNFLYMFFLWWEYPLPISSQRICLCLVRFLTWEAYNIDRSKRLLHYWMSCWHDGLDFPAGETTAVDSVDMTSWQHIPKPVVPTKIWYVQMKNHGRRFRCCLDQGQHGGVWNSFFCCKVGKYNHIDPWCELFCQACFPTFVGLWIQYVVPICPNRIQEPVSNCPSINPTLLKHVPQQKKSKPPFTILLTILL